MNLLFGLARSFFIIEIVAYMREEISHYFPIRERSARFCTLRHSAWFQYLIAAWFAISADQIRVSLFRYEWTCMSQQGVAQSVIPYSDAGCTINGINGVGMISDDVAESDLIIKYLPSGCIAASNAANCCFGLVVTVKQIRNAVTVFFFFSIYYLWKCDRAHLYFYIRYFRATYSLFYSRGWNGRSTDYRLHSSTPVTLLSVNC